MVRKYLETEWKYKASWISFLIGEEIMSYLYAYGENIRKMFQCRKERCSE